MPSQLKTPENAPPLARKVGPERLLVTECFDRLHPGRAACGIERRAGRDEHGEADGAQAEPERELEDAGAENLLRGLLFDEADHEPVPGDREQPRQQQAEQTADESEGIPSVRNSSRIPESRAPSDFQMPISRVRSRTLVKSVFVMPMAATSSEISANKFSPAAISVTSRFTD